MYSGKIENYAQTERNNADMSFDEACTAYFNWKDAVSESAQEYSDRIRKLKLLATFKSIIENELTDEQKNMLTMKYFEGKSGEEIGRVYGVTRSTVSRDLMKITEIFKTRMKYVFEYADTDLRNEEFPLYIELAVSTMAENASKVKSTGERMRKVRLKKMLTSVAVAECTGVSDKRIERFENGGPLAFDEFVKLILFYRISADQVIFGV